MIAGNRPLVLVAAAAYNAIWGVVAIIAPRRLARPSGFDGRGETIGWRATGVMVLAYAPAYVWAARHPEAARPIVATALFGKSLGAAGWLAGWLTGRFRIRTALLTLLNDAIWLPTRVRVPREMSDPRAGAWLSGLILGVVSGLTLVTFGTIGLIIALLSLALIVWKGPRALAAAGLLMGIGLIWSVLFARVGLDCTVFVDSGEGCEAGSIWSWVAVSVAFFVGGIVASAFALKRTNR